MLLTKSMFNLNRDHTTVELVLIKPMVVIL